MTEREALNEIAAIGSLDRAGCLARWRDMRGRPPPKHLSVGFMRRALIREAQCMALGGVPTSLDRALRRIASGDDPAAMSRHCLRPGRHLMREWNGRTYQVEVLDRGFRMDGRSYRSLSAIAKKNHPGGVVRPALLRADMRTRVRCAIYTRKSSEDGLEQAFNSLDAQREACAAYIKSQKAEGWVLIPERYDDGGLSGGTLERPALQRLLTAIDNGVVDQIIVYKIDRLTRSLADFAKIVDRLDAAEASFVSVTQSFNTATSMGRLTLNMLLSFAQFEREVTAERIRDKLAASKKKGLWMGGSIPLGYAPDGRSLKIAEPDADVIRTIYDLYQEHRNARMVKRELDALGLKTPVRTLCSGRVKGGASFGYKHIHYILTNPVYAGRIRHHAKVYPGQHPALIRPEIWDDLQERLRSDSPKDRTLTRRNRGKTRLIIGGAPAAIDETLLRNIGRAHRYFDLVRAVKTFDEIADAEGVSKRRIQHLIELAFLAPDVIRSVREGRQPVGMTSDGLNRHAFSPIWSEQREKFSTL